jgi:hypothetical protein
VHTLHRRSCRLEYVLSVNFFTSKRIAISCTPERVSINPVLPGTHSPFGATSCTALAEEVAACGAQIGMDYGGDPTVSVRMDTNVEGSEFEMSCGYAPTVRAALGRLNALSVFL